MMVTYKKEKWSDIPRFTNNGNGTMTDNLTGLMWQRVSTIIQPKRKWEDAFNYVSNLQIGGYNDWRLPNRKELLSLTHWGELSTK